MPKLLTGVTLCMLVCVGVCTHCGYGHHENHGNDDPEDGGHEIHPDYRNLMFHYVIMRGCAYTAGYIRAHFTSRFHSHPDHQHPDDDQPHTRVASDNNVLRPLVMEDTHEQSCDWKSWVQKTGIQYHVPHELTNKLIDCGGVSYSLMAFNVSDSQWAHCNHSNSLMAIDVGRRHTEHLSGSIQMANQYDSSDHREDMNYGWHDNQHHSFTGEPIHSHKLKSWCKKFSCKILRQYHLGDKSYKHTSPYWLVNFYRMAEKYHMPKSYMYGLVGCGMEYALQAFNALGHNAAYT